MNAIIRFAHPSEAAAASNVARAAKAHWGYSSALLTMWQPQLLLTPAYIAAHAVFVAEVDRAVVGVCAMEEHGTHRELTHLWVLPSAQGRGIGSALLRRVREESVGRIGPLRVESDPHAAIFYERAGGVRVGAVAAAIPSEPDRTLPIFEFGSVAAPEVDFEGQR